MMSANKENFEKNSNQVSCYAIILPNGSAGGSDN